MLNNLNADYSVLTPRGCRCDFKEISCFFVLFAVCERTARAFARLSLTLGTGSDETWSVIGNNSSESPGFFAADAARD